MVKEILKRILLVIILAVGSFTFHIGLILIAQGEYFYKITSKEKFDELADRMIIEMMNKREEFKEICKSLDIFCNSFDEIVNQTCKKSEEIKEQYENLIKEIVKNSNLNEEDAIRIICSRDKDACNQIYLAKQYLKQLETLCHELKKSKEDIEIEKEKIYEKELVNNISLRKFNESLKNSFAIGILMISIGVILIYLSKRSFQKLLDNVFKIMFFTGLVCLLIWFVGSEIATRFLIERIESNTLKNFLLEIFEFEKNSGILISFLGALGLLLVYSYSIFRSQACEKSKTSKIKKNKI